MVGRLPVLRQTAQRDLARSPRALCWVAASFPRADRGLGTSRPRLGHRLSLCVSASGFGITESLHTRQILRYTLPTYASTIASEFAENRNFWSQYGCSSVVI